MKKTKSMYCNDSEESKELFLFTVNDSIIYENMIKSVISNLQKKYKKGVYDHDKAIFAYYPICCYSAKKYNKLFGAYNYQIFSVTDRYTCSAEMEKYFFEDIQECK